jgi:23S rRNA (uracil1939-C5)-methyltransferase
VQLTIEKLIYGGDGLARVPAAGDERRGKTVFISGVLPGEIVEARAVEERKGYTRAEVVEIIAPSPERVAPACPHYERCGGCHYQHLSYPAQLEAKKQILRETILRGARVELPEITVHSAEPWAFRNRTRMKITPGTEFAIGYHGRGSHELEPVRECPISSPLINRALSLLWQMQSELAACESLREVQFFANHDDSGLRIEFFIHHATRPAELAEVTRSIRERMPEVVGVAVFATGGAGEDADDASLESTRLLTRAGKPFIDGADALPYKVGNFSYQVSAGGFFQTNRHLTQRLVEIVAGGRKGHAALDLYAGGGLFTLPLAAVFEKVTAVEVAPVSYHDLVRNVPRHGVRTVESTTEDFLRTARAGWDFVVADPPRAGLGERTARLLAGLKAPRVVLVSCDPATLSRDLPALVTAGYQVEAAHIVDLFPQTYHMESVLHLVRAAKPD